MLDFQAASDRIAKVKYKPGWKFGLREDKPFGQTYYFLDIDAWVQDVDDPDTMISVRTREIIDPWAVHSLDELDEVVARTVHRVEYHEIDEWLIIDGKHHREPHPENLISPALRA